MHIAISAFSDLAKPMVGMSSSGDVEGSVDEWEDGGSVEVVNGGCRSKGAHLYQCV